MNNNLLISINETTNETVLIVNGKTINGIVGFSAAADSKFQMPVVNILMVNPETIELPEIKKSILQDIKILKAMPYVNLSFKE